MRGFRTVFAFVLLACAGTASAAPEKVKIEFGVYPYGDMATSSWLPAFKKAYPNIDVQMTVRAYVNHHEAMIFAMFGRRHGRCD